MSSSAHSESNGGLSKHRLEALCDGIFAFAMTLLVLDMKMPKLPESSLGPGVLTHLLLNLWPKFLGYVTSFLVLSVFWIGHHGYSHFVKKTDRWFLWINLLFLMMVVLVPFSTDFLGDYPAHFEAVVFYGLNIMALGLTLYWQWHYATSRHRLVGTHLEPELARRGKQRILRGVLTYACAVATAWLNPTISMILYALIPVSYILPGHLDHHWTHSHD